MTNTNNLIPALEISWHKMAPNAVIPTKRAHDAGYDIYTNLEHDVTIYPHEKYLFPTGLQMRMNRHDYWLMGFDRGSTGSKGLHLHCGVVDNNYRGEIFICICNDNDYPVTFTKSVDKYKKNETKYAVSDEAYYPLSKAIAQLIPVQIPNITSVEVSDEDWDKLMRAEEGNERGDGKLGSSGK